MRGKKTTTRKQDIFQEICEMVDLPFCDEWKSTGSTITASGFEALLIKLGQQRGIPPNHLMSYEKTIWRLLHKSTDSMLMAIEIINKPSISYRMESFLFLVINAWELLLKAKVVHDNRHEESIKDKNYPDHTIPFKRVLNIIFPSEDDPLKINLKRIEDLRNHATHLFIPFVPREALLLFQACILNYENKIKEWFNRSLSEKLPVGMIFLVMNFLQNKSELSILEKQISSESIDFVKYWQGQVRDDIDHINSIHNTQLGLYAIPININIAVVNNPKKADLIAVLDNSSDNIPIAYKHRRLIDDYPLTYKQILVDVKDKRPAIKQNEFDSIIKNKKIKDNKKYSAYNFRNKDQAEIYEKTRVLPKGTPSIYNKEAIEYIVAQYDELIK